MFPHGPKTNPAVQKSKTADYTALKNLKTRHFGPLEQGTPSKTPQCTKENVEVISQRLSNPMTLAESLVPLSGTPDHS